MDGFRLPQAVLAHCFRDGDAKRGVAIQDGDAHLNLSDLAIKITRHEALTQQFHAMHPLPGRVMQSMTPRGWSRHGFCGGIRSISSRVPDPDT